MGNGVRNALFGLLALCVWALGFYGLYRTPALGLAAPLSQFSAARAELVLARLLGPELPHPTGSAAQAAVQARLLGELTGLGLKPTILHRMGCYGERRAHEVTCATVNDMVAQVAPGNGGAKAILLLAHADSVAAGPGASDDLSGVATILETIRALKARGIAGRHPILALFTDGEELDMLGAAAFLDDPAWRARIGMVINVEARGNQGPSYLFQVSHGNEKLIDLYAASVTHYAASSLYGEIYKYLPSDTDLTLFLARGIPGYNFAFIGNVADYHTSLDRRENLDPASLQSHGDNVLGVTQSLETADFAKPARGDAVYLDILGRWLPRLPQSFALPLALGEFLLLALAGWWRRKQTALPPRHGLASVAPLLLLLGCLAAGFALHEIAALVSRNANPAFAHPAALRLGLGLGVWSVALLAARLKPGATVCWLWLAGFGVVTAIWFPGLSPYFIFPGLAAAILLAMTARRWDGLRQGALLLAALAGMIVWLVFAASGEAIAGLVAHPLFTLPAGFALVALLPLLEKDSRLRPAIAAGLAVAAAIVAGFLPAYSVAAPERLNLRYVETGGRALWLADPVAHLPSALRQAVGFSHDIAAVPASSPGYRMRGYIGDAGSPLYPMPKAEVARQDNQLRLALDGSAQADGMMLALPAGARFATLAVNGRRVEAPDASRFTCMGRECAHAVVTASFAGKIPSSLSLVEMRHGLPAKGAALLKARPAIAVPSGPGDQTLLMTEVRLPN